jgi:hypothetical protein
VKTLALPVRDIRLAGVAMIGAGLLWPLVDQHVSITCPLRAATGIPCPLCGMTTSVVATAHGDPAAALAANPAGVIAIALALWVLVTRRDRIEIPNLVVPLALGAMWVFELFRFDVL